MYTYSTTIRIHHTDAAGVIFFGSLFRLADDAFEDFLDDAGVSIQSIVNDETYALPIVHAEADYIAPMRLGNQIDIQLSLKSRGQHSFTLNYIFINEQSIKVATAETVHVSIDKKTGTKIDLPIELQTIF